MNKFIYSFLLFLPLMAFAIGVPTSGIDWTSSSVTIESFNASHPSHQTNFQCFGSGYSDLPISTTLDQLAFASSAAGPDTEIGTLTGSTCFQQAGEYALEVTLVDNAGNTGTTEAYVLTVRAAEAGTLLTTLEPIAYTKETNNPVVNTIEGNTTDCTVERLVSNNDDSCTLQLTLRDDFGNVVEIPSAGGRLSVLGRDTTNTNLDLINDPEGAYIDSLRLNNSVNTIPFSTNADGQLNFQVGALAPTIEIISSPTNAAFKLSRMIARSTPFQFPIPDVASDGSLLGTTNNSTASVDLQFEPWVKLFLSDEAAVAGSPSAPSEPLYFLQGEQKPLYAFADTMLDHFLPGSFEVFIKGFTRPVGLFFEAEDLTNGTSDIDGDGVTEGLAINVAGNARSRESAFETRIKSINGLFGDENIALGSKIRHTFTEAGLVKRVLYPGGNLGSSIGPEEAFPGIAFPDPNLPGGQPGTTTALLIGADIEGKVLANTDIRLISAEETELVSLGGVSTLDMREDLLRNATQLTRGLNPINAPGSNVNFSLNSGFSGDVAYFKDTTVTLTTGSNPMIFSGGVKTIIIEDGNLFIPNDLQYGSIDDSLGIILVNSSTNVQETGNIFVKNTVQRLVGTYYADGSMLSTDVLNNPQYADTIANRNLTNVDDPNAPLGLQLLLEGTILSRNTLGGALIDPPQTPWGDATQEEAIKYDFHFVRRYVPPVDPVTFALLPDTANGQCVKVAGVCDRNRHSFVIRADGRVNTLTPPGFGELSGFSAQ